MHETLTLYEIVNVWYILESKNDYQVYCHIHMQNQDQSMDEEDVGNTLTRVLDILELPTRKSIQVDICDTPAPQIAQQMIKFGFESAGYVLLLNLLIFGITFLRMKR